VTVRHPGLVVVGLTLLVGLPQLALASGGKPRVLVLHSYHHGFTWSDNISAGVHEAFKGREDDVELLFEFMDTRRVQTEAYFVQLEALYRAKYAARPVDVLLCADDNALIFALGRGRAAFGDVPIVFCSVTGFRPSMREGRQLTGLRESIEIKATLDVALRLHPRTRKVAVITDMTRTGRALKAKAERVFAAYRSRLSFRYLEDMTVERLREEVSRLSDDTIVFLFIFSRDKAGRVFSHERNLRVLARRAKVPIYSVWEFYLGNGIVGGKLTNGRAEGRMAGKMALAILDGTPASSIPLGRSPTFYMFDERKLDQFGVDEALLPEGSVVRYKPFSFYEAYRALIWGVIGVFVVLLAIVAFLLGNIVLRKRVERALRDSEEKYRRLVENANDGIVIMQDRVCRFHNLRALEITGYSAGELDRLDFLELVHPAERRLFVERYEQTLREGRAVTTSGRGVTKDGREILVDSSAVVVSWEGKPALMVFFRDVTRQRRLEDQLAQAQKMEAVGTLAGGVAHDFNNLLMGVSGLASLMLDEEDLPPEHRDNLRQIELYVGRASELTRQLLGFARGGKYEVRPTDPAELVQTTAEMFARTKKELRVLHEHQEGVWTVEVDRGQMEQVLLNLYLNAAQAMPEGGELRLETRNVELHRKEVEAWDIAPGSYVRFSVTDTGVGMDPETRQRIFDPFFTTKEPGRGTGLGLAMVYGIIKNHDGMITVSSKEGAGTTFNLFLPARKGLAVAATNADARAPRGVGTVLLVDDEEIAIKIGRRMLERLGYKVITAQSGAQALELIKRGEQIDIVLLDMVMPEMSGGETFDRIREVAPDLKVVLSSGYSRDSQAEAIMSRGCLGFLQKPYRLEDLGARLRRITIRNSRVSTG